MANKQHRELSADVLSVDGNKTKHIVVSLDYQLGGMNYWSYKQEPRGYYLGCHIETREQHDGFSMHGFTLGAGIKSFIEPAKMFSAKKLAAIEPNPELVERLKASVLAKGE